MSSTGDSDEPRSQTRLPCTSFAFADTEEKLRLLTVASILVSTVAGVAAIVLLPLLHEYVHTMRSYWERERQWCRAETELINEAYKTLGGTSVITTNQPPSNRTKRAWMFGQYTPDGNFQISTITTDTVGSPPEPTSPGSSWGHSKSFFEIAAAPQSSAGGYGMKEECCTCHTGPPGLPGAPGYDGAPGEDGKPGGPGKSGYSGKVNKTGTEPEPPCVICPTGEPGPEGAPGKPGLIGPQGNRGPSGMPGRNGALGPPGPEGIMGVHGPQGPQGWVGERGKWLGNLGPKGRPGQDGLQGSMGPAGQRGEDGKPGRFGAVGPRGDKGKRAGPAGSPGNPGLPGRPGPPGHAGPCGQCPAPRLPPGY